MGQPVAFFEVISPDAERAQKFYAELFGWQVSADPAMGGYALVDTGAGEGAVGATDPPADDEQQEETDEALRALAEPRRRAILRLVAQDELAAGEIAAD